MAAGKREELRDLALSQAWAFSQPHQERRASQAQITRFIRYGDPGGIEKEPTNPQVDEMVAKVLSGEKLVVE